MAYGGQRYGGYGSRDDDEDSPELCAVSGEGCDGACREQHLEQFGIRCPAWYTEDMIKRKRSRRR